MKKPSINVKAKRKAFDNVSVILNSIAVFQDATEDEMMNTLRELRRISADFKDSPTELSVLGIYINHVEEVLKNVYISAEELLKEAREKNKGYSYQHNRVVDILFCTTGYTTKGSNGQDYYALTTSTWGGNHKPIVSCNIYGWTDKFEGDYADETSMEIALGTLAADSFKGPIVEKNGIKFALVRLFPHILAERKGKKSTPKEIIEANSPPKGDKKATPDLKGHVPLDRVGGQSLQPAS